MNTFQVVVVLATAGSLLPAQTWTLGGTSPAMAFGTAGDLLVHDGTGPLGFDEVQARTLLRCSTGWVELPANVPARLDATLVAGNQAFLFGGLLATGYGNDLHRFDRTLGDWVPCATTGLAAGGPSPRAGCKAAAFGGNASLLFFGGADAQGLPADTWLLLPFTAVSMWAQQPTPAALTGRLRHALAAGPDGGIVLFGGLNTGALGDTWIFNNAGWTQYTGLGPPAAFDCRMAFDAGRNMTVLAHSNGDTWEWNGFHWRRVGVVNGPAWQAPVLLFETDGAGGARVVARQLGNGVLETWDYTPSVADFQLTMDWMCMAGTHPLELAAVERCLPVLGQAMHLRATGVPPQSLMVFAYELSTQFTMPLGCGCMLGVTGNGGLHLTTGGSVRDWLLPIADDAALLGVAIDVQGIVLDFASACSLLTTPRGTLIPGR